MHRRSKLIGSAAVVVAASGLPFALPTAPATAAGSERDRHISVTWSTTFTTLANEEVTCSVTAHAQWSATFDRAAIGRHKTHLVTG
jgi:hypothetical protein